MTFLKRVIGKIARTCADLFMAVPSGHFRHSFLKHLMRKHTSLAFSLVTTPSGINESLVPRKIETFLDLVFLFWSNPLNRGFLRLDLDEAAALFKCVKDNAFVSGVEIGRRYGGSTLLIAGAMPENGRLTSIDLTPQNDEILKMILSRTGLSEKVDLRVGSSQTVSVNGEMDFVFIDGDHHYDAAKKDHLLWGKKVKAGGYIIHHDMGRSREMATQWPDLKRLKEEILKVQASEVSLVLEAGSLVVFKKTSGRWTDF